MPLLHERLSHLVAHSPPFDQLLSFGLTFQAVDYGPEHEQEAEHSLLIDLVVIEDARDGDAEQNPGGHNQREDNGSEIFDGVENEKLTHRRAHRKQKKMQMYLWMAAEKLKCAAKLVVVDERYERQDRREGRGREEQLDHAQTAMMLKHSGLPVAGEGVEN
mmetsp:Transcript_38383/g.89236  ORF Transcript_38383/g.89236 Transcript_38383/m.89236 type:complete len:161 (+) Transcript_38383:348-830(+)